MINAHGQLTVSACFCVIFARRRCSCPTHPLSDFLWKSNPVLPIRASPFRGQSCLAYTFRGIIGASGQVATAFSVAPRCPVILRYRIEIFFLKVYVFSLCPDAPIFFAKGYRFSWCTHVILLATHSRIRPYI